MASRHNLHAIDVAVAVALVAEPDAAYGRLAERLGLGVSTVHGAVGRLAFAGLLRPGGRVVNRLALREFLAHGLRYAFPARPGRTLRGVPTAHAGPSLRGRLMASEPYVWPTADGDAVGPAVTPLYPAAVELPRRSPAVYDLLSLADALRVGRARERGAALEALDAYLAA